MQPSDILSHSGPQVARVILECGVSMVERERGRQREGKGEAIRTYVGNTTQRRSVRPCIRTPMTPSNSGDPRPHQGTQSDATFFVSAVCSEGGRSRLTPGEAISARFWPMMPVVILAIYT